MLDFDIPALSVLIEFAAFLVSVVALVIGVKNKKRITKLEGNFNTVIQRSIHMPMMFGGDGGGGGSGPGGGAGGAGGGVVYRPSQISDIHQD